MTECAVDSGVIHLHVMQLHEPAVVDGNYDRFHMLWLMDDSNGNSRPKIKSSAATATTTDDTCGAEEWKGIAFGDLLYFPELQSGAGEFEGLRFAGERSDELFGGNIPLLKPGIESIEFPPDISVMAEKRETSLRNLYEKPLEALLEIQGGRMNLSDIYGGSDVLEEFWAKPDIMRRRTPLASEDDKWIIPLSGCTLIETRSFDVEK